MKLTEVIDIINEPATEQEQVASWLREKRKNGQIGEYFIQRDGTIDVTGSVFINVGDGEVLLPAKFGKVTQDFDASGSNLTSIGGLPHYVGNTISLRNSGIHSLSGINKIVKHISNQFIGDSNMTHILGLLLIDGLTVIRMDGATIDRIMNKYLGTRDIVGAQDELIDAGFKDQARM